MIEIIFNSYQIQKLTMDEKQWFSNLRLLQEPG